MIIKNSLLQAKEQFKLADTIPLNFPIPSSNRSLNVGAADAASGITLLPITGFTTSTTDSATITPFAIPSSIGDSLIPPDNLEALRTLVGAFNNATYQQRINLDFDMTPNAYTTVVQGTAFCEVTWGVDNSASRGSTGYAEFSVIHVDKNNNENVIGTVVGDAVSPGGGVAEITVDLLHCELDKTNVTTGEKLRLNVSVWAKTDGGGSDADTVLMHNPANEDVSAGVFGTISASADHTYLKFLIPYKITG